MNKKWTLLLFVCLITCCKKEDRPVVGDNGSVKDFSKLFELFWNGVNDNYIYWDIDPTDWNAVYYQYKPVFNRLNINDSTDVKKSLDYFRQMTSSLIDSHFQVAFETRVLNGIVLYPSMDRKEKRADFYFPFDYQKIDFKYFDPGYLSVYRLTNTDSDPLHLISATIGKKIIYLSFNKFALSEAYNAPEGDSIRAALDLFFKRLNDDNYKGLIIDVRNNFGGNLIDLNFLMGYLINKPLKFGYSRYKANRGRLDYTPWIETIVNPNKDAKGFEYPVIVLTDNYTVSLGETIAMAIHTMPNGKIVGDTTWGATGPLADHDIFNAGQFEIPGFLKIYTSSAAYKYIDNKIYEGVGFNPDVPVLFDLQKLNSGVDPSLEKAVSLVNQH